MQTKFTPKVDPMAPTKAGKVMSLLESINLRVALTEDGKPFAFFSKNGHTEIYRLKSSAFQNIIAAIYYHTTKDGISPNTMNEVLSALKGKALDAGVIYPIKLRLGGTRDKILLDMCDENWRVAIITKDGYQIESMETPAFFRIPGMQALPIPNPFVGKVSELWPLLNISNPDDRMMIEAWLVSALIPGLSVPVLVLNGEQGSAKSTATRVLRNLIDPHDAPLRTLPNIEKDIFITASNCRVLAYDNISGFQKDISDALCKVATGGSYGARELYTDGEEVILKAHNPIIMNGIADFLTRGDIVDRSVVINLSPINATERQDDETFNKEFRLSHPTILAGLLDTLVKVLQTLPAIEKEKHSLPRMAAFALVGIALERINSWPAGAFLDAYARRLAETNKTSLEANLVADRVCKMMATRTTNWVGTASALLAELGNIDFGKVEKNHHWPQTAHKLSQELKRLRPALLVVGIEIEWQRNSSERTIIIKKKAQKPLYLAKPVAGSEPGL